MMFLFLLILVVGIPMLVFVLNAALNAFTRIDPHKTPFVAGHAVTLLAVVAYCAVQVGLSGSLQLSIVLGILYLLCYCGCVTFLNWFVFTLTDVSMHVRTAYVIHTAGRLTPEQIQKRYNKSFILGNRLARLLELGQLKVRDGRYFTGGGEVLVGAAVCKLLRVVLGIPVAPELQDHYRT